MSKLIVSGISQYIIFDTSVIHIIEIDKVSDLSTGKGEENKFGQKVSTLLTTANTTAPIRLLKE